ARAPHSSIRSGKSWQRRYYLTTSGIAHRTPVSSTTKTVSAWNDRGRTEERRANYSSQPPLRQLRAVRCDLAVPHVVDAAAPYPRFRNGDRRGTHRSFLAHPASHAQSLFRTGRS